MLGKRLIVAPDDDTLSRQDGWQSLGKNRYAACRFHLLVSSKRDAHQMDGPSFTEPEIPARATYTWTKRRVETTKYVSTFESSLKRTVSTRQPPK